MGECDGESVRKKERKKERERVGLLTCGGECRSVDERTSEMESEQ